MKWVITCAGAMGWMLALSGSAAVRSEWLQSGAYLVAAAAWAWMLRDVVSVAAAELEPPCSRLGHTLASALAQSDCTEVRVKLIVRHHDDGNRYDYVFQPVRGEA